MAGIAINMRLLLRLLLVMTALVAVSESYKSRYCPKTYLLRTSYRVRECYRGSPPMCLYVLRIRYEERTNYRNCCPDWGGTYCHTPICSGGCPTGEECTAIGGDDDNVGCYPLLTTSESFHGNQSLTESPTASPEDPCLEARGGCDQFCTSVNGEVNCSCSQSYVQSTVDDRRCDDPCEFTPTPCQHSCHVVKHMPTCVCDDGFTQDKFNDVKCVERDDCIGAECWNGATCVDLVGRYICDCPGDWRGTHCNITVTHPPEVVGVHPLQGPVAGGTPLTITGAHLIPGVLLRLGQDILCPYVNSTDTISIVTTRPYRDGQPPQSLSISVVPRLRTADPRLGVHVYRKPETVVDPSLGVEYSLFLRRGDSLRGGTKLTVAGRQLHVITQPKLQVTMRDGEIVKNYYGLCYVMNSTTMICVTPAIEAPASPTRAPDDLEIPENAKKRRRSAPMVEAERDPIEKSQKRRRSAPTVEAERNPESKKRRSAPTVEAERSLELYMGFSLEGVRDYQDLRDTKDMIDYSRITYHTTPPTLFYSDSDEYDVFVPRSGAKIRIQGENLLLGFEPSDYTIHIGRGVCDDMDVTDNEMACAPPDHLPAPVQRSPAPAEHTNAGNSGSSETASDADPEGEVVYRDVRVLVGSYLEFSAGRLGYRVPHEETTSGFPVLVVAMVLGAAGLFLLASVIGVIGHRRLEKEKSVRAQRKGT